MNAIRWFQESCRRRGLVQTLQIAADSLIDLSFDWRHGTDTMAWVSAGELETSSPNRCHAVRYQASKARPLSILFRKLSWARDTVFVDFGSGKGRVLLMAAQFPVKRVVGIEFSPKLCLVARQNIESFRRKHPGLAPIEVVESDATAYGIRDDENVFFMYNPFAPVIVEQVLRAIQRSVQTRPRPISLIYNTPIAHDAVERCGLFARCEEYLVGGTEFRVYAS